VAPSRKSNRAPAILNCGPLTVAISRVARNRLLVELDGELDIASAKELERRFYMPRQVKVDLDLTRLTFIDVPGARLLRAICEKRGGKAEVVATSPAARRALEVSGLRTDEVSPSG
jgi:anti-anti-sigma factor